MEKNATNKAPETPKGTVSERFSPLGVREVMAQYTETPDKIYPFNAWVEALPPPPPFEKLVNRLQRRLRYDPSQRDLPPGERVELVQLIKNYVEVLDPTLEFERRFRRVLRHRYGVINPISTMSRKQMDATYEGLEWSDPYYTPVENRKGEGFTMIGPSGLGKTTMVDSVVSTYPQVIRHVNYRGIPFDQVQVVYIKTECPPDGSVRSLYLDLLAQIDRLGGGITRYYRNYERATSNLLLRPMEEAIQTAGLGVLIIDEIQRLSSAKSGGDVVLMDHLVQLNNKVSTPIITIGQPKALNLYYGEEGLARRASGQGDMVLLPFGFDESWDYFINGLWGYQYTAARTDITPDLSKAMHEESGGIIDFAVKIYQLTQWHLIGREDETITASVIRGVAKDSLKISKNYLSKLRSGDILPDDLGVATREMVNEAHKMALGRVTLAGGIATLRNLRDMELNGGKTNLRPVSTIVEALVRAGCSLERATECATKALGRHAEGTDVKIAIAEALLLASEPPEDVETPSKKPPRRKKVNKVSLSGDLRQIVEIARKDNIPPYEALEAAGVFRPADEFIR